MRKLLVFSVPVLALAACDPPVPNSAAGVGFGDYQTYLHQREAELRGQPAAAAPAPAQAVAPGGAYGTTGYGATPVTSAAGQAEASAPMATTASDGTIGADTLAALRATSATEAPAAPAAQDAGAPLDAMAPAADPVVTRGATGPNLAAYALSATNAPGQPVYKRGGFKLIKTERACAKYVSPDLAQMAFLERGGPQKDPGNLDPDGDGFACGWDPRPFQAARQ
ncbi:hypothetical protein SAMN05877809_101412 [Rhodobacter sp. JA431]|uniref:hypothetical protein n=1 Tax=Rhodobacter sp. JA431 TaxID=570013 RepID=UPI000BD4F8EA|nr:hypothetical protein [Rhodobacter sp. JA431]SOB91701.1 hypothetical protein SAMN05877809_101412 [Rhodobacter sp. JA431]